VSLFANAAKGRAQHNQRPQHNAQPIRPQRPQHNAPAIRPPRNNPPRRHYPPLPEQPRWRYWGFLLLGK